MKIKGKGNKFEGFVANLENVESITDFKYFLFFVKLEEVDGVLTGDTSIGIPIEDGEKYYSKLEPFQLSYVDIEVQNENPITLDDSDGSSEDLHYVLTDKKTISILNKSGDETDISKVIEVDGLSHLLCDFMNDLKMKEK